ncbi:hypothetical protein C8R46DRAFT_1108667 [Mycena filopes]|nr:hypothetical protein C8R46DRAFT_1108667 [Mycena filopes]
MPRLLLSASVSALVLLYIIPLATAQPLRLIKRDSTIGHSAGLAIGLSLLGLGLLIFVSLVCCGCCSTSSTRTAAAVTATDEGEGGATEIDGELTTEPAGNTAKSDSLAGEVALLRERVQQLEEEERARVRGASGIASTSEAAPPTEPPPTYVRAVKEIQ